MQRLLFLLFCQGHLDKLSVHQYLELHHVRLLEKVIFLHHLKRLSDGVGATHALRAHVQALALICVGVLILQQIQVYILDVSDQVFKLEETMLQGLNLTGQINGRLRVILIVFIVDGQDELEEVQELLERAILKVDITVYLL